MPGSSADRPIRIASWNIHGAIGRDGLCLPERIERVVSGMAADIVALQEVDGRTHLRRRERAFERMAEFLGDHVVEARLHGSPGREHGNMLWSRWPIRDARVHLLPGGFEQRAMIEARIDAPQGPVTVFAAHLGLLTATRIRQVRAMVRSIEADTGPHAQVLVGDLNEWLPAGPVHRALAARLPQALRPATFPARRPFARLDRLYASSGVVARIVEAPGEAAIASDHLPLMADLRFL